MLSLSSSADSVRLEELTATTPTSTRSAKVASTLPSSTHRRPSWLYQAENVRPCRRSLRKRERSAFVIPCDTARRPPSRNS